jgi:SNF2 family DNA or RNA helicase
MKETISFASHDADFVYFRTTPTIAAKLSAVYLPTIRMWKVPITKTAVKELLTYHNHPTLKKLGQKLEDDFDKMEVLRNHTTVSYDRLRPYQAVDVNIIKENPVLAIFNEQRTGKTPTILTALDHLSTGIIVCPSSLKLNWFNEANKWSKQKFVIVHGTKKKRQALYDNRTTETLIISYETLRSDIENIMKLKKFNYLVVDEAHRLRNYNTKQSKALFKLRKLTDRVHPMTGTPAVNHPSDVYGILRLLHPVKYRSYWQFVERYFAVIDTYFGKELGTIRKDREQEFHNLMYMESLQRKRREVMQWVPKVDFHTIELEPSAKQLTLFKEIIRKSTVNGEPIPNAITKLTRLRQVCVDPMYFGVETKTPKQAFIMDYLEDNPEPVIIFSTMTQTLNRLKAIIPDSVLLTGEQSTVEKQWAVDQIQSGQARVLLANIRAGGVGFTLDKVDTIIFLDKSYTPDENQQAADRIVPTDPSKEYGAKQVITLVVNGSVEPKIEEMLDKKIDIIKYVNDYGIEGLFSIGKTK